METSPVKQPWLRRELIAPWWEIIVVAAVCIGWPIFNSAWESWHGSRTKYISLLLTDSRMLHGIAAESVVLAALLYFLSRRGWTTADLRIKPGGMSTLQGGGLLFAMMIGNTVTVVVLFALSFALQHGNETVLQFVSHNAPHLQKNSIVISWATLVPTVILNGFYEEITTMGYVFNQFASKWGPAVGLAVLVLMRMACHTYQDPVHVMGIGVVFTIAGLVYIYTRNLWPLIFAHILLDMASMGFIKILFGKT